MLNACCTTKTVNQNVRQNISARLAANAQTLLTQAGFKVFLARQAGQVISLPEHLLLAQQFNAQILIILALAHQKNKTVHKTNVTTSYNAGPAPSRSHQGFLMLNMPNCDYLSLFKTTPRFTHNSCQELAAVIHKNIVHTFRNYPKLTHECNVLPLDTTQKTPFTVHISLTFHDKQETFFMTEKEQATIAHGLAQAFRQYFAH
ncbi:hypothetical protein K2X40_04650 [Candidatus Babeliales bacterium]|nr:hypothetical protein [Candidatus Babeliales bacterium]MBY0353785.1 hypothetical protein [Candidatus Babeliales bacterium]